MPRRLRNLAHLKHSAERALEIFETMRGPYESRPNEEQAALITELGCLWRRHSSDEHLETFLNEIVGPESNGERVVVMLTNCIRGWDQLHKDGRFDPDGVLLPGG